MKLTKTILTLALSIVLLANLSTAVILNSVDAPILKPGEEGVIRIELEKM